MRETIKACPFCGSKWVDVCRTNPQACWIRCYKCDVETASHPTREGAIKIWNKRYIPKEYAEIYDDDDKEEQ